VAPFPHTAHTHLLKRRNAWQVAKSQVYRLAREGRLPAVAIGRYYRFRLAALIEWEQNGGGER
jgi:excisionase family DNA binding protein